MTIHIDPQALQAISSLQRPGKPDLQKRIVELFKSESPDIIAALQQGIDSADLSVILNAAHSLKSSSAQVGAVQLSERCRDVEAAAREENLLACIALGDGVDSLFQGSVEALALHVGLPD